MPVPAPVPVPLPPPRKKPVVTVKTSEIGSAMASSSSVPVPPPRKKPVITVKTSEIGSAMASSSNVPVPPPRKRQQRQKRTKTRTKSVSKGVRKKEREKRSEQKGKACCYGKKQKDIDVIPRFEETVKIKSKPTVCERLIENKVMDRNVFASNFRSEGISYLDKLSKNELKRIVCVANDAYYNENAFLTDDEYDVLREYVEKNDKTANFGVGAKATRNKVTLPYFMGSMDKIKPDTQAVSKWQLKYNGPYVVSAKLDGVSGLFMVQDGVQKLYTRGDGIVGQDISHLIPHLRLPNAMEGLQYVVNL